MFPAVRLPALSCGLLLSLTAAPALASSPQAWRDYDRQVLNACLAGSSLRNPRALGSRVDVPGSGRGGDGSLTSALLLEGKARQPHMRGRRQLELCLYDQRSRTARVVEADALLPANLLGGSAQP